MNPDLIELWFEEVGYAPHVDMCNAFYWHPVTIVHIPIAIHKYLQNSHDTKIIRSYNVTLLFFIFSDYMLDKIVYIYFLVEESNSWQYHYENAPLLHTDFS